MRNALGLFKDKNKQVDCSNDGGGGKCKPMGGARSGTYKSEEYRPGKAVKYTKKEEQEAEKEWMINRALLKANKKEPFSTSPGVRGRKKGSQYFFGRNRGESEV